jgi:hypothetical protein
MTPRGAARSPIAEAAQPLISQAGRAEEAVALGNGRELVSSLERARSRDPEWSDEDLRKVAKKKAEKAMAKILNEFPAKRPSR